MPFPVTEMGTAAAAFTRGRAERTTNDQPTEGVAGVRAKGLRTTSRSETHSQVFRVASLWPVPAPSARAGGALYAAQDRGGDGVGGRKGGGTAGGTILTIAWVVHPGSSDRSVEAAGEGPGALRATNARRGRVVCMGGCVGNVGAAGSDTVGGQAQ